MVHVMKNIRGHDLALSLVHQLRQESFWQKVHLFLTTSTRVRSAGKRFKCKIWGKNKPWGQKNWDTRMQNLEIGLKQPGLFPELAVRPNWATWGKRNYTARTMIAIEADNRI